MNKPVSQLARLRIPIAAWPSLLSLDAVAVAVVWQQLIMRSLCNRLATWPEMLALAASVWLIYVADRLLDAARLDLSRPHTLRHRFYRRHRRMFFACWVLVLLCGTLIVVRHLSPTLIQGGLVLGAAVLIYGAGIHFSPRGSTSAASPAPFSLLSLRIPKEVRVGTLFAVGVSLTAWIELCCSGSENWQVFRQASPLLTLVAATSLMAILFSINCMLVSRFESEIDRAQSFVSIGTNRSGDSAPTRNGARQVSAALAVAALPMLWLFVQLPVSVLVAVSVSAFGLCLSGLLPNGDDGARRSTGQRTRFDFRGAIVDGVLWIPAVLLIWFA